MVKEWLYQCLNDEFNIVKSPKSFNSQIGLPISLLQIDDRYNLGIFEVGISQPEEMKVFKNYLNRRTKLNFVPLYTLRSIWEDSPLKPLSLPLIEY